MASSGEHSRTLVSALNNSARDANILHDEDTDNVNKLIEEFFTSSLSTNDEIASSDDESHSDSSPKQSGDEDSEPEGTDRPIVDVSEPVLLCDIQEGMDLSRDRERTAVKNFDCKCKIKHLPSSSSSSGASSAKSVDWNASKQGCISQFSSEEVLTTRMTMVEYTEAEKDVLLQGILTATPMNTSEMTLLKPHRQTKRQRQRTTYIVQSHTVCRETFKFIYGISQNKLTALLKHYHAHGVALRKKRSGWRLFNTKAFSPDDVQRVVDFLHNFAEDHALVLPGRVPGFRKTDVKIIPFSQTKAAVWRHYRNLAFERGHRIVDKSCFFQFWQQYVPFIVVGKPRTDLCWRCKQNNDKIRRTANLPEELKLQQLQEQMEHLRIIDSERKYYREMVAKSKATAAAAGITKLGPHPPNSMPGRFHYSFDFAQQIHYPSSPMQPGPTYFLTPRKCGIFGVCAEGLPQQINYLIDEGMTCSKGSNIVISLLHHFFEFYGLGEQCLDLHCDNCSGQNKNNFVLFYLALRVMHGLNKEITVNFIPAGHTKFAPDWCFGLIKRRFHISEVHCLQDMVHVVDTSSIKGVNRAHLVGTEDGKVLVNVYDWQTFFGTNFHMLKDIKANHHFRFSSDRPGFVFHRRRLEDVETAFQLSRDVSAAQNALSLPPPLIPPPGLSEARQRYLQQQIRPFVRPDVQDLVCPSVKLEIDS